ncbi:hypothetical protein ESY86_20695 [Subsaximicrobium wynnwilliamsii]|uniref:Lipoprotein n=1 Tax=Subsaximicrobium wynnwilliamsii TaxID=291179 RepID=A0A5C6ZBV6_9FLAO|nr:hypothetical protein [Subsaximicrobium wynnwilliamsii]TXD81004.1 hypothetical protein ESY87_19665 [Subsaximicrobium wynnwilliamsii]TXD85974.1 hypothetical protein ESY86_20695 [Subsaximicrobium wynnwilliamsii]TXD99334.1 hypothetical protein ESY88_20645 [Subsaximicrobium wynnwilliamsii]
MNKVLIIFLIIGLYSCGEKQKSEKKAEIVEVEKTASKLKDFELVQDFEQNKAEFRIDKFELNDHSADGGELTVFHNKNFDYVVLDFWLYGETGKLNYTFWTEKEGNMKFKFVKQLKYEYDKPYYVENYKTDSIIRYLTYSDSRIKLFDINKTEITESEQIEKSKSELESFFTDVTKGIEIIK